MSFAQIRQRSGEKYRSPPKGTFAASSSASTDLTTDQTNLIHPDPLVFAIDSGFSRRKLDVIRSIVGWAQTRPRPTRGHPY